MPAKLQARDLSMMESAARCAVAPTRLIQHTSKSTRLGLHSAFFDSLVQDRQKEQYGAFRTSIKLISNGVRVIPDAACTFQMRHTGTTG